MNISRFLLSATALLTAIPIAAQPPVAPTPERVGPIRGDEAGNYNIVNSWETGYRFADISGNHGKYRSDVNYGNGIRLLGSSLTAHSKDGRGGYFDELVLTTQGLGNDPYQTALLRIQKNKLYRYDFLWRESQYFNPALTISDGFHAIDTTRRLQDHDITMLPQSSFRFHFGYSRNVQDGPALTTVQVFDSRGNEFPLFSNIERRFREYRFGAEAKVAGFQVQIWRSWQRYEEDTASRRDTSGEGLNPNSTTTLDQFQRTEPYRGSTPLWRFHLHREERLWAINGRLTYSGGRRDFLFDESAQGTARFGINRQVLVSGNARRPLTTGDFAVSLLPTGRLTLVNNTSIHSIRIDGDSTYREVNNAIASDDLLYFSFLGIRTITNATDVNYRARKWLGLYGGYHYSTRRNRSVQSLRFPPFDGDRTEATQDNQVQTALAGMRIKPAAPLTLSLDGAVSRADRPFTPISDRNFHTLGARVQYKSRSLLLSTAYRLNYNTNSETLSSHSSRARNYSADASWTPAGWFAVDASYSRLHLDTVSGLAFFAGGEVLDQFRSIYISNIHAGSLGVRIGLRKRADLYLGYTITRDAGDGRPRPVLGTGETNSLLDPWQTYPLRFESPQARLSIPLHRRFRLNFGWQFYHYREDFPVIEPFQNYRGHTGYTSLLWSF